MNLGVLTSGGDAPGMNAVIRAVVRYANHEGIPVYGIYYGYKGLSEGENNIKVFTEADVAQIINRGGTILRSARYPEFKNKKERVNALRILNAMHISNLVVIGGDGSFNGAQALFETNSREQIIDHLFIVCIPASIDNDIPFTKLSIGTDTALNTAVQCIDKLRDTAYSHRRVFVIQVMGRNCDYLPYMTGISAGASFVFPPEYQFKRKNNNREIDLSELVQRISIGFDIGKDFFMVIVSEGVSESLKEINPKYEPSTPADIIAREIDNELKKKVNDIIVSVRPVVLGYVQRGGTPSHIDRLLAARLGVHAIKEILDSPGTPGGPGNIEPIMVGLQNAGGDEITKDIIVSVPLKKVLDELKGKIPNIDPGCKILLDYVTR
jgi:6-phosphofructokinase 1